MTQTVRNILPLALVSVLLLTSCASTNAELAVVDEVQRKNSFVYFDFPASTPLRNRANAAQDGSYGVSLSLPDSTTLGIFRDALSGQCSAENAKNDPWVGVTSPEQSESGGECVAFKNLGGSSDIYRTTKNTDPKYGNAITIFAGRHNTPAVADQWNSLYEQFNNPSEHMYATGAVNTNIDALAMKTASGVNTSGFADQMNFWAITDMTFNMG